MLPVCVLRAATRKLNIRPVALSVQSSYRFMSMPALSSLQPGRHPSILRAAIGLLLALLSLSGSALAQVLQPMDLGDGVYAFIGANAEPTAENAGFIGNSGFIVGPEGVIVIDSGGSRQQGEAMLRAIADVTSKPVVLVIITHAIQDFVFGAAAFRDRDIALLTHRKTAELMKARCEHCLDTVRRSVGDAPFLNTRLIIPEQQVDGDVTLTLTGRDVVVIHPGWASTPGDLLVFDRQSRVLFAGGVVTSQRIPELRDGDFEGWLSALERLRALDPKVVVPGYGPPQPAAPLQMSSYLRDLDARLRSLYADGTGLTETIDRADLAAYQSWVLYPDQHRRNALRRYLQLEVEDLERH